MKPDRKKKQPARRSTRPAEKKKSPQTTRIRSDVKESFADVEPTAGSEVAPVWLFVLMGILLYSGMLYLDSYAGGFNPKVYEGYASYKEVSNANPKSGPEMLIAKGESLYMVCAACHQVNGKGVTGQFPPLVESEWVNETNPSRLIAIPLFGLAGPIEVNGEPWNAPMAALGTAMSSEDFAAILSYIRQAWGNDAPPVSVADVDAVKAQHQSRPMDGSRPWTGPELMQISVDP